MSELLRARGLLSVGEATLAARCCIATSHQSKTISGKSSELSENICSSFAASRSIQKLAFTLISFSRTHSAQARSHVLLVSICDSGGSACERLLLFCVGCSVLKTDWKVFTFSKHRFYSNLESEQYINHRGKVPPTCKHWQCEQIKPNRCHRLTTYEAHKPTIYPWECTAGWLQGSHHAANDQTFWLWVKSKSQQWNTISPYLIFMPSGW